MLQRKTESVGMMILTLGGLLSSVGIFYSFCLLYLQLFSQEEQFQVTKATFLAKMGISSRKENANVIGKMPRMTIYLFYFFCNL